MTGLIQPDGRPASASPEKGKPPIMATLVSGQCVIATPGDGFWHFPLLVVPTERACSFMPILMPYRDKTRMPAPKPEQVLHSSSDIEPSIVELYGRAVSQLRIQFSGLVPAPQGMPPASLLGDPAVGGGRR